MIIREADRIDSRQGQDIGHVPWAATYKALRAAKYDDFITIEAFGRAMPALAAATRVWRDFFPTRESVYREGLKQMQQGWAKAK